MLMLLGWGLLGVACGLVYLTVCWVAVGGRLGVVGLVLQEGDAVHTGVVAILWVRMVLRKVV